MTDILKEIGVIIISTIVTLSGFVGGFFQQEPFVEVGRGSDGTCFVSARVSRLSGAGVSASQSTINLQSFVTPNNSLAITMTDFCNTVGYGVIDPTSSSKKELVSFTGITQSADGTAQLTGVVRGLGFTQPYTASTTLQTAHSGGSRFVISNTPQFYTQFTANENTETIDDVWTFSSTTQPVYDGSPSFTNDLSLITKKYADDLANQGAATSTESTGGIVELATRTEGASTTPTTTNKPLVLQAQHGTSTPGVNITTAGGTGETYVVWSEDDGKLNRGWIDDTEAITFTGLNQWSGGASTTAYSILDTLFVGRTASSSIQGDTTGTSTIQGYLTVSGNTNSSSTISSNLDISGQTITNTLSVTGTTTNVIAHGYERITNTGNLNGGSPATVTITVDCSPGRIVISGGFNGPATSVEYGATDSYPSDKDTWTVLYHGGNSTSDTITAYAICVNP